MNLHHLRRRTLPAALLAAMTAVAPLSWAQADYPQRPVKLLVPFAPGGPVDVVARSVGEKLAKTIGQPVVVENKPGANAIIGATACRNAPADGYTYCVLLSDTVVINPSVYKSLSYQPLKDFAPVALLARIDTAVVVPADMPVNSLPELAAYASKVPGSLNWGHFGTGSSAHLYMTLFNKAFNAKLVDVPFTGGAPTAMALLSNQVQVASLAYGLVGPHIQAGKLKAIAVIGPRPSKSFPGVVPAAQQGIPFSSVSWVGLFAPTGVDPGVLAKVNAEVNAALKQEDVLKTLDRHGMFAVGGEASILETLVKEDMGPWEKVAKDANINLK